MKVRLVKKEIDKLLTQEYASDRLIYDDKLPGFMLRITPGAAAFFAQLRVDGKVCRMKIGRFGHITAEEARNKARELLGQMSQGIDPNRAKAEKRVQSLTLAETWESYQQTHTLRPKTIEVYESALRRCFGDWLRKPMASINRDMVEKRHKKIANANGPRGKGDAQASQAMRVLRCLFTHAMDKLSDSTGKPIIIENPVKYLNRIRRGWSRVHTRQDIISDHDLKAWYQGVMGLESKTAQDYLLLCLFTGLRRGEAARLKWENIDRDSIRIPAEDVKTNEEHRLPMSDFLAELLTKRSKVRSLTNPYVFPGKDGIGYLKEPKSSVKQVIKLSAVQFRMHDLRRTFETIAERLDISHYALKRLLNHKTGDITARYIVTQVDRLREPMQRITDYIKEKADITVVRATPAAKIANSSD